MEERHERTVLTLQGCAPAEFGSPWQLTFVIGRPGNIGVCTKRIIFMLGALDLKGLDIMVSQLLYLEHSLALSTMVLSYFLRCMFCFLGDMLDEVTAIVPGYNAYFSFSKVKTGYSGKLKKAKRSFKAYLIYK